jgi:hypothetical protein
VEPGAAQSEVQAAVRDAHSLREPNRGEADWRVHGLRANGRRFAVIYDHPVQGQRNTVRIVSVWTLRSAVGPQPSWLPQLS